MERKLFKTLIGKEVDFETIYDRIIKLIPADAAKPDKQSVKNHLNNLQSILKGKEEIYKAVEWKDGTIYILEPLFLFYLRWGRIDE